MVVPRATSTNWPTLLLLIVMASFGVTHAATVAPLLNEMTETFQMSEGLVGQLGTLTYLAMAVAAVSVVPFIQRWPLRPVLVGGMLCLGAASIFTGLVPWFGVLLAVRFGAGAAAGVVAAGCVAALGRVWVDPEVRARRQGFVVAAIAGGPGAIAPILRVVAAAYSWEAALVAAGVAMIGVAALGLFVFPVMPGDQEGLVISARERLEAATAVPRMPVIGPVLLMRMMGLASTSCAVAYVAKFTTGTYTDGDAWIGPLFAGTAAGFAASAMLSGVVIPRIGGPMRAATVGVSAQLAVASLFLWVTPTPVFTFLMFTGWGFISGFYFNSLITLLYEHSGTRQSAVMFVDGASWQIGGVIGVAAGGLAVAATTGLVGFQIALTVIPALVLLPVPFAWRAVRRQAALAARS